MSTTATDDFTLLVRQDMTDPRSVPAGPGTAIVFSSRSPYKSTENEDGLAVVADARSRAVLAVADGVGGQAAGDVAAKTALSSLCTCVRAVIDGDEPLRAAILNGLEQGNEQVLALATGAATTIAVLEIEGASVRSYHVGDAAVLVTGQRGKIRHQTVDHSPVGYAVEAGLLCEREAIHHEDRHIVSNVIGSSDMRIDVGPEFDLRPRDTVALGSDGLFDNLHVAEIIELMRKGPLAVAAAALRTTARQRMADPRPGEPSKPDDLTFIVYRGKSGPATGRPGD